MTENPEMPGFESIKGNNFTWVNIDSPDPETLNFIAGLYSFHHLDIEDCLSKTQLPKIEEYENYLFIILHFPRFLKEKRFSIPVQVAMFLGRDFLVTVHNGELKAINNFFKKCADKGVCPDYMGGSPSFLLYKILYAAVENLMLMMGKVIFNIEELEERVFDEKTDAVREVTELRHNIANLRRIIFPLKRVIHEMEKKIQRFSNEDMAIYFSDLADLTDRAWTILDECRETIEIFKDTDFIISSDRTNKILAVLTILFTFSIPVTLLGTLYGMNIRLPGGSNDPWLFWGPYTTFWIILAASAMPMAVMYFIFRRLRWL
jgi:magnesium transporter